MRKRTVVLLAAALLMLPAALFAWGHRGHAIINENAVGLLPEPLKEFFSLYADEITAHASDPDIWVERKVFAPAYTHFIDLEDLDNAPFAGIPRDYNAAARKFGLNALKKAGTLPWEIARRKEELTAAFRDHRWEDVVKDAAWIGHYLADSTMPLHATRDYQGRAAGNVIIEERVPYRTAHQRIESELLEHFKREYESVRGDPGNVKYLDDPLGAEWQALHESNALVAKVLAADREAFDADSQFGRTFYWILDKRCGAVVKKRLATGQELVASVWLTAWEDAGKPELPTTREDVGWPDIGAKAVGSGRRQVEQVPALLTVLAIITLVVFKALRRGGRFRTR